MFNFELTEDDLKRNQELTSRATGYNKIIVGGFVLAANQIQFRKRSFQVKTKSWLKRKDLNIPEQPKVTERTNPDGTRSRIIETIEILDNGTQRKTIVEQTFATSKQETTTSEGLTIPLAQPGTSVSTANPQPWTEKLVNTKTKTIRRPKGSSTEFITEVIEDDPENPKNRRKFTKKYTNEQQPLFKPQPIQYITITGDVIYQEIAPLPPQGVDDTWWNQDMYDIEESEEVNTIRNDDGTETTVTTLRSTNPDGIFKEEITEVTQDIEVEDSTHYKVTKTERAPEQEVVTVSLYNKDKALISSTKTSTLKYDVLTGAPTPIQRTETEETVTDNFGKVIQTVSISMLNPITGEEDIDETETIINPGQDQIEYSRNITRDHETGIQNADITVTITDGLGNTRTSTKNERTTFNSTRTTRETITSETDDDLLDDMINGWLVTEYEFSGELMSMPQVHRLQNKYFQHQNAWAFLEVREQQLALGDRVSPEMRKKLWHEYQAVFNGESGETVRGGDVLDRIEVYAYGERAIPAVFAPGPDSFEATPIPGTYGLFSWRLRLQTYEQIVRDRSNTFREEQAGGNYARLDKNHWIGGKIQSDHAEDDVKFGSGWTYA